MYIINCYFLDYIESLLSSYILRNKVITDKQRKKEQFIFLSGFCSNGLGLRCHAFAIFVFWQKLV